MKEKIDWYQEVLELEPGSKVFFPLARLLVASNQTECAVQTLRHGLERHPEYIEARLYLIDILFKNGKKEECSQQIEQLTPLFARYTGFWQAWGKSLALSGKDGDAGVALSFLAAVFQQGPLTLGNVVERGLHSLLDDASLTRGAVADAVPGATCAHEVSLVSDAAPAVVSAVSPSTESSLATNEAVHTSPVTPSGTLGDAVSTPPACADAMPAPAVVPPLPGEAPSAMSPHTAHTLTAVAEEAEDGDEAEERFSLRTRSMAEVLAEQGDFAGALEIYQELAAAASLPEEAADLQYRISTLTAHLGAAQECVSAAPTAPMADVHNGKHRVLSVLEALAERLETRVHG